jgi:UrcA family protein
MSDAADYSLVPVVVRHQHFVSKEATMNMSSRILPRRGTLGLFLAVLALCGIFHVTASSASPSVDPAESTAVRYEDLDLAKPDAVAELYRRIQVAAHRVCNAAITYHYLRMAPVRHECYRQTIADAVGRANLSLLTALHAERRSQSAPRVRPRAELSLFDTI